MTFIVKFIFKIVDGINTLFYTLLTINVARIHLYGF